MNLLVYYASSAQSVPCEAWGDHRQNYARDYLFLAGDIKNHLSNFTYTILDELVFDGEARGCTARVDMDLVEDGAQMSLHSTRADH